MGACVCRLALQNLFWQTTFYDTRSTLWRNNFVSWTVQKGALDHWTAYHIAAGLFIAKVAQWLGASDLWAVLWVLIIGIAWEIFELVHEECGKIDQTFLVQKDLDAKHQEDNKVSMGLELMDILTTTYDDLT